MHRFDAFNPICPSLLDGNLYQGGFMSLSLEVRKFINSEHIGEYITVVLPSELPVDKQEVRDVNREKAAATAAEDAAAVCAEEAEHASSALAAAIAALKARSAELAAAQAEAAELAAERDKLAPSRDAATAQHDSAKADYDAKHNIYKERLEAFRSAEQALADSEATVGDANRILNECKVRAEEASASLAAESASGERIGERLAELSASVAEARVMSEEADRQAASAADDLSAATAEFEELQSKASSLAAAVKSAAKLTAEAQKLAASAQKNHIKAMEELSSSNEAVQAAEKNAKINRSDAARNKLNTARQKNAAVKVRVDEAKAALNRAEGEYKAAAEAERAANAEYEDASEALSLLRGRMDEASSAAAEASARAAEARARLSSLESLISDADSAKQRNACSVEDAEKLVIDTKTALLNAEQELKRRSESLDKARAALEEARTAMEHSLGVLSESESLYNSKKAVYDAENSVYGDADSRVAAAEDRARLLQAEVFSLTTARNNAEDRSQTAAERAALSRENALEKRNAVRVIQTRYETVNVHYVREGVGEDIILVHTIGQSLYTFRNIISKLSANFRVTAIDLPGFGYSGRPEIFGYSMEEYADFIARFMDAMGMETAHFYGFSMGAGYLIYFAKKYPERIGSLVMLSPGGITPDMPLSIRMMESGLFGSFAVRAFNFRSVEKMLSGCFFDLTNINDDVVNEYFRPVADAEARRIIRTCLYNYDDEGMIGSLRNVKCPTLLLWGNEDKWHPTEMSNIFRAALPNCTYEEIRNAGHLSHEEKAERVALSIKRFIPCGYEQ